MYIYAWYYLFDIRSIHSSVLSRRRVINLIRLFNFRDVPFLKKLSSDWIHILKADPIPDPIINDDLVVKDRLDDFVYVPRFPNVPRPKYNQSSPCIR